MTGVGPCIKIHVDRRPNRPTVYGLFRKTFRDNGDVRHHTGGRVTSVSPSQLQAMRDFGPQGCLKESDTRHEIQCPRESGVVLAAFS